jgi:hypothetical protein
MSCTGFDPTNFTNTLATTVAAAVKQILEARDKPTGNEEVTFAIHQHLQGRISLTTQQALEQRSSQKQRNLYHPDLASRNPLSEFC